MALFDYRATNPTGAIVDGVIEAGSIELASDILKDGGFFVVSIEPQAKKGLLAFELTFLQRVTIRDLVIFSRQYAVLIGASVPLVTGLRTVVRQTANPLMRKIIAAVADEVESGAPLSLSMSKYPKVFSHFFVNMIRSGETSGRLEEVMNYLADQMERDFDLMSKIKGAMIYPIFIMFGLVVVGFVMMTFVVPKLTAVLQESGAKLPWTTRALIATSTFMSHNVILILIAAAIVVGLFMTWKGSASGRLVWDKFKLHIPIFGPILQRIYVIRFTRSLSTMISGGIDIPTSLDITAEIVGNAHYQQLIAHTKKEVLDGNSITTVFTREATYSHDAPESLFGLISESLGGFWYKFFPKRATMPNMVTQMMGVGEETGRLHEVLARLTEFYSRELSNMVANLVSAIEPLIMMVMGLAVGVMVSAILLPMYNLATQF